MSSVLDKIKEMREGAKKADVKYYAKKSGSFLNPASFDEGKTVIRIAPGHNDEISILPIRTTYLEVELPIDKLSNWYLKKLIISQKLFKQFKIEKIEELSEWEDDKLKSELKTILGEGFLYKVSKRVFISTVHGKAGDKDLVEEYIKFNVSKVNEEMTGNEAKTRLIPIFGNFKKGDERIAGIIPSNNFKFLGWDWSGDKTLYNIEIYDDMMKQVEELYIKFDIEDEPLTVDPFSSLKEGIGIQFDKYKNEKKKWAWRIDDAPFNHKKYSTHAEFRDTFKLSKEQLAELKEARSLKESIGRGSFKKADFEVQLNGLLLFDEKNQYNAFKSDDFLEIVEEIAKQYEGEEAEEQEKEDKKSGKDIDKVFSKTTLKVETPKEVAPEVIAPDPKPETKVEENSFKEETPKVEGKKATTAPPSALNARLEALRKNMKK